MLETGQEIKNDVGEKFTVTEIFGALALDELEDDETEGYYVEVRDSNELEISGVAILKSTNTAFVFEFLNEDEAATEDEDAES